MTPFELKETKGFLTNIDSPDIGQDFASELRGMICDQDGAIGRRDFGTLNRITGCPVPIRPNAFKAITLVSKVTTPWTVTTASTTGLSNGDTVFIDECQGILAANSQFVVTNVVVNRSFQLVGTIGDGGTTAASGIWTKTPISIIRDFTFVDTTTGTEYNGIVGLDSASNTRIYVYDAGWIELSRSFGAVINEGGGIGATDQQFDFDALTEGGVAYTNANNEYNNWIVVNTSKSNQTVFITDSSTTGAATGNLVVDTVVGSSGLGWSNNDELNIYRFPCFKFNYTFTNGATPLVNFLQVEAQRKMAILYTDSSTIPAARQPIQIMRRAERKYFYNLSATAYTVTLPSGWYCESEFGMLNPYMGNDGTVESPTSGYVPGTSGYTATVTSSTNSLPGVLTTSVNLCSTDQPVIVMGLSQNTGLNGYWAVTKNSTSNFDLKNSYGLAIGSGGVMVATTEIPIYNKASNRNWLSIYSCNSSGSAIVKNRNIRVYVTVTYDNYQQSDPVFQGVFRGIYEFEYHFAYGVCFALMNKNITAINIYASTANETTYSAGWIDASNDYSLISSIQVQTLTDTTNQFWSQQSLAYREKSYFGYMSSSYYMIDSSRVASSIASAAPTLFSNLNHEPDKIRTYPTPRYAIQLSRSQGSMVIIDEDDNTLRRSNQNGDGNNEDDNFPNITVGGSNGEIKLKDYLLGIGELQGLAYLNGQLHAFKKSEKDVIGIDTGTQESRKCDFSAKKSLLTTQYGIFYAGEYAMYLIPSNGGEADVLNGAWQNLYDGRKTIASSATSKITSTYRSEIVSAFSDYNNAIWSVVCMNKDGVGTEYVAFVFSFNEKPISREKVGWYQRKLNIGTDGSVKSFSSKKSDKTLTIAYANGILQYPNTLGSYLYQDDVLINGASAQISQSKGIPTKIKINFGSFYSIFNKTIYDKFKIDFVGSSISSTGAFNVKFYANDVLYETKTFPIDSKPVRRGLPPIGSLERFSIQIDITEGSESDIKELIISTLGFDYEKKKYIGNK